MRKVSFFTPAFNSAASLPGAVASLRVQTVKPWEILSVADGGDPSSWETAVSLGVHVLDDHAGKNLGLAASCNTALKHCTGEFFAKVDSDVALAPFWLEKCLPHFADDRVAGVGGRLVETYSQTLAGKWRSQFMRQNWGTEAQVNPDFLFGADCIFRVEALKSVGGWNARYKTNFEDVDLSQRLRKAGWLLIYEPKATARHLRQDSLSGVLSNYWRWYKDAPEDAGFFRSVESAAKLVEQHCFRVTQQVAQAAILGENPELAYPSLLLFFWLCLSDLEYLGVRGVLPEEAVRATQEVLIFASLNHAGMPDFLRDALAKDLAIWRRYDPQSGWQADPTYIAAFAGSLGRLEYGPFAKWAMAMGVEVKEAVA